MTLKTASLVALVAMLIVGLAEESQAKGPESATLTGPGIERPIELIDPAKSFDSYQNDAPIRLLGLTGLWAGPRTARATPPEDLGDAYTITWVNMGPPGDPIEKRTIYQDIYLDAAGGPLIHTPEQMSLEGWGLEVVGWFEAPEELAATIKEVIAWSTTAEAVALRSDDPNGLAVSEESTTAKAIPPTPVETVSASVETNTEASLPRLWLAMAAATALGALVVWQRHPARRRPTS
jgi:hypothetical protein